MDVLCTFKTRWRANIRIMIVPKTSNHIKINIKMPNLNLEPAASSKTPNENLKDMDVLWTLKIKKESQNLDYVCIKDQWSCKTKDHDPKPQSGTSSNLQSPNWRLKGHGYSLHLQNQEREPKFGLLVSKPSDHIRIKIKMQNPNLKQTNYLTNADIFRANLRRTKYLLKAELLWDIPSWAELVLSFNSNYPDLRLICAELSLFSLMCQILWIILFYLALFKMTFRTITSSAEHILASDQVSLNWS